MFSLVSQSHLRTPASRPEMPVNNPPPQATPSPYCTILIKLRQSVVDHEPFSRVAVPDSFILIVLVRRLVHYQISAGTTPLRIAHDRFTIKTREISYFGQPCDLWIPRLELLRKIGVFLK